MLLAATLLPKPLFVAKLVPVALNAHTYVSDARRDLTAVGATEAYGGDWVVRDAMVVFKGRSSLGPGTRAGEGPFMEAVKILGPKRVIVAISRDQTHWTYRAGRVVGDAFRLNGPKIPKPLIDERPVLSEPPKEMRFPRDLWPRLYRQGYDLGDTITATWWRLPSGLRIGAGSSQPYHIATDIAAYGVEIGASFFEQSDGTLAPLDTVVQVPKGVSLGRILWVSRKGWIVVETESVDTKRSGLAWLYPTRL